MSAAQSVTATFNLDPVTYTLTVAKAGTGTGTVTSSPAGISCGADCSEAYNSGTVVTLSQAATAGSTFAGWSGACTGTGACQVTMSAAKSVTATFNLNPVTYTLTVAKAGTGSGTVTSSPAGISCGADCSEAYSSGTVVTLSQAAPAGSFFAGWSGACTGTSSCQVTMSAAKSVTATFNLNPPQDFFSLTPCRVLDTRGPAGTFGGPALPAGQVRALTLAGRCEVPASARAVAVNLTVTEPTAQGNLTLYPADQAAPPTSALNYAAGQTRANNAIVGLSPLGALAIRCSQASGTADVILDVTGYFE